MAIKLGPIVNEIHAAGFGFAYLPAHTEAEGTILMSAENYNEAAFKDETGETPARAADYYGEFVSGRPWIAPELEAIAEKHGCYWEWENSGAICLAH